MEDCVNAVGVDLNTASVPLLTQVSGLNRSLAENIVRLPRGATGPSPTASALDGGPALRGQDLPAVRRLPARAGRRRAPGRLRRPPGGLPGGAAHPAIEAGKGIRELIGDSATLRRLNPAEFTDDQFGLPTVQDILAELEKPGRDPRPEFRPPSSWRGSRP